MRGYLLDQLVLVRDHTASVLDLVHGTGDDIGRHVHGESDNDGLLLVNGECALDGSEGCDGGSEEAHGGLETWVT
jgi:hypothetical protein